MKLYCTEIKATDWRTGRMTTWCGPEVPGISEADAQNYADQHFGGYLKVIGELVAEIPCKRGTYEADFSKMIDHENGSLN